MMRRPHLLHGRRDELLALGRRSRQVVLLSAVTGLLTGGAVALFEHLTSGVTFERITHAPVAVQAGAPLVGLLLAAAALRWLAAGATPSTADEYIKNFHERDRRLALAPVAGRLLASMATLGLGGALGYEGPSIYMGASIGSILQRRLSRFFSRDDAKVLLVAGAAAGVAAIFKAPATGAVFALEVPYQDDLARRMLLPALFGAGVSYVTFVSFASTTPLLPISGAPPFDLRDLGGAVVLGLLGGFGARGFAFLLRRAKRISARVPPFAGAAGAGLVLAALAVGSNAIYGSPLTVGPGYRTVTYALDPRHGITLILGLLALRAVATATTLAGGGAGGLFIPLVIEGALLGRLIGGVFGEPTSSLFPVIGIAAFLGAGYRVPLAAVMFVAESTGRPGFVVPGLLAAVGAQLVMGRSSVSTYQVADRAGHLERRFDLPLATALLTDVLTVPPDATVAEFFWHHLVGNRQTVVPVVEGARYLGMVRLEGLHDVPRDEWETTEVARIMETGLPTALPGWNLGQALSAMEHADVDRIPVVDDDGCFVGIVSTSQILRLDDILDQTE
ncbi:MAG: chloride channel protein family [Acidimicrobiaceae bacterium]|jgi:CIC family chloride channel protein|nr:chloride channel protein family [Acidimicrobiaceae bacterium]